MLAQRRLPEGAIGSELVWLARQVNDATDRQTLHKLYRQGEPACRWSPHKRPRDGAPFRRRYSSYRLLFASGWRIEHEVIRHSGPIVFVHLRDETYVEDRVKIDGNLKLLSVPRA